MRQPAFSNATGELVASCGHTVKNLLHVYRASGEHFADFIDQRWAAALDRSQDGLTAEARRNAKATHDFVGALYHRGLAFSASSAEAAVDALVALAHQGMRQAAVQAANLEERIGVPSFDKLAQVAVPAAVAATRAVDQLQRTASDWAQRIAAGQPPSARHRSAFAKARARRAR